MVEGINLNDWTTERLAADAAADFMLASVSNAANELSEAAVLYGTGSAAYSLIQMHVDWLGIVASRGETIAPWTAIAEIESLVTRSVMTSMSPNDAWNAALPRIRALVSSCTTKRGTFNMSLERLNNLIHYRRGRFGEWKGEEKVANELVRVNNRLKAGSVALREGLTQLDTLAAALDDLREQRSGVRLFLVPEGTNE